MRVQEIMTKSVRSIDPNTAIRDAARCMRDDNLGALPVCEGDRLIGMVTDRDIVTRGVAENKSGGNASVRDVMSEGACYCYEDDDDRRAAAIMAEHQVRRLPVLNRENRLVGVVALADLAQSGAKVVDKTMAAVSEPTDQPRR